MGGIVHDINNLLVSIIGYAQYSMEIEDVDEIRKCLNQINKLAFDGKKFTEKVKCEIRGDKGIQRISTGLTILSKTV